MSEKIEFSYFYGNEADTYSFYRIPKILFTCEIFKDLSTEAKVLYGLMLDRMALSVKNNWLDSEKRAFIYFSNEEIMSYLGCKKNKAIDIMKELDVTTGIGLLEKKRQGLGKPTIIYVKNFNVEAVQRFEKQTSVNAEMEDISESKSSANDEIIENADETGAELTEEAENADLAIVTEVGKTNFKRFEKGTSRSLKNKLLEVGNTNPNNTDINNNKYNNTYSNHILSEYEKGIDESLSVIPDVVAENIELELLKENHPYDQEMIQGMYELILETMLCQNEKFVIAGAEYPAAIVKGRFMKLTYTHIEYVMECLRNNTTKVVNIKKYLLATLFNAPSTIKSYYQAEVNHDLPQYTGNAM